MLYRLVEEKRIQNGLFTAKEELDGVDKYRTCPVAELCICG